MVSRSTGAFVAADTWRGHRSIHFRVDTDQDGRFEWRSAPKDVVLYDFGHDGYMASRQVPLTASDRERRHHVTSEARDHRPRDRCRDRTPGAQVPRRPGPPV